MRWWWRRKQWVLLAAVLILAGCGKRLDQKSRETEEQKLWNAAESHYQGGEFAEAQRNYLVIIEKYPISPMAQRAQFMVAKCYLAQGKEREALEEFKRYAQNNRESSELREAQEIIIRLEHQRFQEHQAKAQQTLQEIQEENFRLRQALQALRPVLDAQEVYLELDLENNRLHVKMGTETLYDFPVVSGKGETRLKYTGEERDFSTPLGIREVQAKEEDPVWYRPNWFWLEQGEPVPEDVGLEDRAVPGALGKYRLYLGEGYSIHGTASGRIRSGRYSHGCVRMNAADLKKVWEMTKEGTKVFIY
jgi:lipoprotein-anchoring transpeptidase ErfK/SrfK